jgi:hypothetical protein
MTYEKFKTIIEKLEKVRERSSNLYQLGINLMEHEEVYHEIITDLMLSVFDKEGKDWIDWYLYERPSFNGKEPLKAFDLDGKEICHNIESLWETVKEYINEKDN